MAKGPKKLTKKAKQLIKSDFIVAAIIVSVLVNLFFFSGVILFSSTNELDASLYDAAYKNYCVENYIENLEREVEEAPDAATGRAAYEIACRSGEFQRYYENAVEAYLNDTL